MASVHSHGESIFHPNINGISSNFLLVNPANQINSVKLSDDNFLLWHLQIFAGVRGLGLDAYIIDEPPIPPRLLNGDESPLGSINTLYITWVRQDQLMFSFLLASMTETVQNQMIGCETSAQIWARVTSLFATRSKAKVMQYKLHLQTLKKGALSMKDYINKMKGYIDILSACGHPISNEDQILYLLSGLGLEYDAVVVHVTSKTETLSFPEVGALLMTHEGRLESFNLNPGTTTPTVNTVELNKFKKPESSHSSSGNTYTSSGNHRGRGRGRQSRGGRRSWTNSDQTADVLTKPLTAATFTRMRSPHPLLSLRGEVKPKDKGP